MNHKLALASLLLALSSTVACGGDDGGGGGDYSAADIEAAAPSGTIEGTAWTMAAALVRLEDDGELSVELSGTEQTEACPFLLEGDSPGVLFSVAGAAGEYPLHFTSFTDAQTVTMFVPPAQNFIATSGMIVVSNLTATEVTIGLVADADTSVVNGTFTTTLCE